MTAYWYKALKFRKPYQIPVPKVSKALPSWRIARISYIQDFSKIEIHWMYRLRLTHMKSVIIFFPLTERGYE